MQHDCNTSTTQVQHECYTNDTSATRVKKFDFADGTSKNISSHPYIYYMTSERLQGEEHFLLKSCLLEMPCFYAKMRLKSAPQKLNVLMAQKVVDYIVVANILARSGIITHSNSFSIKTILCENINILFSKNY